MTKGFRTSEFWLSLAAIVIGGIMGSGILSSEGVALKIAGLAMAVLSALGYTASRTALKKAEK